jgi:aspartate kinase
LSTTIFNRFLIQKGINAQLLPALGFMRIDRNNEPDNFYIKQNLTRLIDAVPEADIYITQGFIALDADGELSNLDRGGSDYTATIIGGAIHAEEVQIWTDIDGFHNNDPRYVMNTSAISNLSFDEAAELAYFGAKILHPQTVMPVRALNIPVRLKNTMSPESYGTLITDQIHGEGIKAIAAKDNITAIKIKSARMLLAHGFLKKVFEIFETYETAIDMVTTSEIAVSLTIDNDTHLKAIVTELRKFATVEVDEFMSIVCLVGNQIIYHPDTPKLFQVLQDVHVRMIAYGGSNNNISLLVNTSDKLETLQKLHRYVFETREVLA